MLAVLLFVRCERVLIAPDGDPTAVATFDELWSTVDRKYSFFGLKGVDWDEVYDRYRPRVQNGMNPIELFDVLSEMLFELRDGHVNLRAPFDVSRHWEWYLNSPPNFNYDVIERNYLGDDHRRTGPLLNVAIDSVGYVYYESFGQFVSDFHIDFVVARYRNAKGLIIDVRGNGGGSLGNVETLVSRFISERMLYSFWRYKAGPGREEFTEPIPQYLEPAGPRTWTRPVVVLTNRSCFSATNDFVLAMQQLPNVTVLGDTTGGGGGVPYFAELPNGWTYRFSTTATLTPDGRDVEEGIPPDVRVDLNPDDEIRGVDTILEEALRRLR
ncbi:MAG: S41 family peptidase [Catalinimonas sp.]